jgi:hypothetical protein
MFLPPVPLPFTVTVSSPPASRQMGFGVAPIEQAWLAMKAA